MIIKERIYKEMEFKSLINSCISYLAHIRDLTHLPIEEREKALDDVQKSIPSLRRYLWYFKNQGK